MRKFYGFLFAAVVISFISLSCSNFTLPEKIQVKAGINPNIPVNSGKFDFSKNFQEELNTVFSEGGDEGIKIFDYTGGGTSIQNFLISFSLKEQSLDFQDYLNQDEDLSGDLQAIKQTFTLDPLGTEDANKIAIDMKDTIADILEGINFPVPDIRGIAGNISPPAIGIPATGFTSLSFYEGSLVLTLSLSIPDDPDTSVTVSNLRINSIPAAGQSQTIKANISPEVSFPLKDATLDNPLSLSFSYTADAAFTLQASIKFSDDVKLKNAKGVSFTTVSGSPLKESTIDLDVPAEFIQATVAAGSIKLDTSALKGVNLDLSEIKIVQDANDAAPSYTDDAGNEKELKAGLDCSNPASGTFNLGKKKINPKPIKPTGEYSLKVANQSNTDITFNEKSELEIPVSFAVDRFSEVYVDGKTVLDDFHDPNANYKKIPVDLTDLAQTVSSIKIKEVGVAVLFGESRIGGLNLTIKSEKFKVDKMEEVKQSQTPVNFTNVTTAKGGSENAFDYNVANNSEPTFEITLASSNGDGEIPVLRLTNIIPGQEVPIIDCQPSLVFDWESATVKPDAALGDGNNFAKGKFPAEGEEGFSLGNSDLGNLLDGIAFEDIKGYLFFSGPAPGENDKITLDLTAYPDTATKDELSNTREIKLIQNPLALPNGDKPFTANVAGLESSLVEDPDKDEYKHLDFTSTFNRMLGGENLSIAYEMDFGSGLTIQNQAAGVKVFKADLVLVVPLKLTSKQGETAEIDVTEYLGGMQNKNLLSFMDDMGQLDVSFNTLTLDINLSGAPLKNGKLSIERAASDHAGEYQTVKIPLNSSNIRLPLAQYLGSNQRFTPIKVALQLGDSTNTGTLQIPRGLSFLSLSVNAGVDATFDL
ncbi:MAG: hypothetical protein LBE17_11290 [Treponema sp.]|jgi:hypothetical protein|nr:hypothetical protein [Treponema sp.]